MKERKGPHEKKEDVDYIEVIEEEEVNIEDLANLADNKKKGFHRSSPAATAVPIRTANAPSNPTNTPSTSPKTSRTTSSQSFQSTSVPIPSVEEPSKAETPREACNAKRYCH